MTSILLFSRDLLFITKIREAVSSVGRELTVVRSAESLEKTRQEIVASNLAAGLLLVDLEKPGVELATIAGVWGELSPRGWRCLSFFSHVHDELSATAQELGLGEILPRSRFIRVLPDILQSL